MNNEESDRNENEGEEEEEEEDLLGGLDDDF
jgi:hypothetical protein